MPSSTHFLPDPPATEQLAATIAPTLRGQNLLFFGALGVGKTAFVRALAAALGVTAKIKSPTFVYLRNYLLPTGGQLVHFDLYRLSEDVTAFPAELAAELAAAFADKNATVAVEWPERLPRDLWPAARVELHLAEQMSGARELKIIHK